MSIRDIDFAIRSNELSSPVISDIDSSIIEPSPQIGLSMSSDLTATNDSNSETRNPTLAVGIGCVWFGIKHEINDDQIYNNFSIADYCDEIYQKLNSLANISELKIMKPDDLTFVFPKTSIDLYEEFFPFVRGLIITFKIYIPARIQEKLSFRVSGKTPENLNVRIEILHDSPVLYVFYEAENFQTSPSDAVVVVRNYIEQEFEKLKSGINFNTLGPSPFHADFFFLPENETSEKTLEFTDESAFGGGYGEFHFYYPDSRNEVGTEIIGRFSNLYGESISCFYCSILHRNKFARIAGSAHLKLTELLDIQTQTGLAGWFHRLIKAPRVSKDLMISILQEQVSKQELELYVRSAKRDMSLHPDSPFESYTDKELDDCTASPVSDIRETIGMFEERYLKNIENGTVIIVGIIGGVIGSAITYLLGK